MEGPHSSFYWCWTGLQDTGWLKEQQPGKWGEKLCGNKASTGCMTQSFFFPWCPINLRLKMNHPNRTMIIPISIVLSRCDTYYFFDDMRFLPATFIWVKENQILFGCLTGWRRKLTYPTNLNLIPKWKNRLFVIALQNPPYKHFLIGPLWLKFG